MVLGALLMAIGSVMALAGASWFASPTDLPELWDRVGYFCFFLFWVPGLSGGSLTLFGAIGWIWQVCRQSQSPPNSLPKT